jgi:hypothetical protein
MNEEKIYLLKEGHDLKINIISWVCDHEDYRDYIVNLESNNRLNISLYNLLLGLCELEKEDYELVIFLKKQDLVKFIRFTTGTLGNYSLGIIHQTFSFSFLKCEYFEKSLNDITQVKRILLEKDIIGDLIL